MYMDPSNFVAVAGRKTRAEIGDIQCESDRAEIILAATGIEDMLEYQILARLPGLKGDIEAQKRLFENDGPLASFSKKLWAAHAMGFVDKPYRKLIDIIREMRNACADGRKPLSFASPEVQTACKAVIKDMLPELKDRSLVTVRNAFVCKCAFINHYLATGEKIEGKEAQLQHWKKLKLKSAAKQSP
jgi:hypothetical protein